ncbi:chloride channel protein [Tepidamorphus sp. 3E244]|uniref:chloride channel protein n=1 Tax=Tepidamorphus sp. 3E244 TaxID=3385498 RepID=UPI0038FD0BBE
MANPFRPLLDLLAEAWRRVVVWASPNVREFLRSKMPAVWTLAIIVGIGVSVAAIGFRLLIGVLQWPWLGDMTEFVASAARNVPWYYVLLAPAVGGLIVGVLIEKLMPGKRAEGVADVIEARAFATRRLGLRSGVTTALISAISIGSGASAGREGPVVHLGGVIATTLTRGFQLPEGSSRMLLAAGVSAAVSASFNAPIAGVLFAHEVILGHYAMSALVPIVISSVLATVVTRVWFGDYPAFFVPEYQITSYWEVPAFVLLGLTCAVVAIVFQFALIGTDYLARNVKIRLMFRPMIGGLLVGAIGLIFPEILGVGYETTDLAMRQMLPLELMLTLLVAKTAATAITLASRFGGGIFSPSLYLGAMTGGAFGLMAASVFPDMASSAGLYSILGMGAVAASVLGAPVSTIVIVFELTGGYAMTLALLLTVSISIGLTQAVHGRSYFHWQLESRGLFLGQGAHKRIGRQFRVRDVMRHLGEGEEQDPVDVEELEAWLTPEDTLESALRRFDEAGKTRVTVVDESEMTRVVGFIYQVDVLRRFTEELIEADKEEHR